jgi:ATPase subunit of ABC transporter with duplicated ATPase domains
VAVVEVNGVAYAHPGGDELFAEVSFRAGNGRHVALVGPNGVGKSTLLHLVAGDLGPSEGSVFVDGTTKLMPQAIGVDGSDQTVRELLIAYSTPRITAAGQELARAELANERQPSERTGIALAEAVAGWAELGGYQEESRWDDCCRRVLRQDLTAAGRRPVGELSGGERKRLVLESLFASEVDILLLDEPDNFLDISGKRWLEHQISSTTKTVLVISHDRELLANAPDTIVTLEGFGAWTHPGSFRTYEAARHKRQAALAEAHDRWKAEERRLFQFYKTMKQRAAANDGMASRANAAENRWRRFVAAGPPPPPVNHRSVQMHLSGSRSGERVLRVDGLEITGLTDPFDLEVFYGDRLAVLGPNGTGKSHFLRLLGGDGSVEHQGSWRLGARVHPGLFHQTDEVAWLARRTPLESLGTLDIADEPAMAALARYGLQDCARRPYETMSGGQKARLQVLTLELRGVNLLLLDEPTDNLDLASGEALEQALEDFAGTVVCVTHDRWFLRAFDRYVVFDHDCTVKEVTDRDSALHLVSGDAGYPFRRSAVHSLATVAS